MGSLSSQLMGRKFGHLAVTQWRESLSLLACLLLYAFITGTPRDATRQFIKPRSAMAYPLAIIRCFGRWSVPMPSYKMLRSALAGLSRMYLDFHGPYSLAPRRAEPMKFSMMRAICNIEPNGQRVG